MERNAKDVKQIKCIVWDLDGTIWDGVLLESDEVKLKPKIKEVIQTLDSRGILHSIASKNVYDVAMQKVREFGLEEYFLYPEISWNAKSSSIKNIQENLNIGLDTMMLIDDQPFERDEVQFEYPEVFCMDALEYLSLSSHPRLNPRFISQDSRRRRLMYLEDIQRKAEEISYQGPKKDFLASLNMAFIIAEAKEEDLKRAEELTVRTNQLNTTGRTYDFNDLKAFINSEKHRLLICELMDKYGSYGKIGLALVEITDDFWLLRLFLMSCRVMSYGVGTVLLSHIMGKAKASGRKLRADFKHTNKNRMMYITFKFANFRDLGSTEAGNVILENDMSTIQEYPPYIDVRIR
jgi:FkbH-like protein